MSEQERLLRAVRRAGKGLTARQIAEAIGIPAAELTKIKRDLNTLVQTGRLVRAGKHFVPAEDAGVPRGKKAAAKVAPERRGTVKTPYARDAAPRASAPVPRPGSLAARRGAWRDDQRARTGAPRKAPPQRGRAEASAPRSKGKSTPRLGADEVIGKLIVRPEGYGFVSRREGPPGDDIFLPPHELRGTLDGDTVKVGIVAGKYGRDAGVLLEVIAHARRHLVGTFHRHGNSTFVAAADPALHAPIRVAPGGARDGQVVKVAITRYPEQGGFEGEVVRVVGEPGDPLVEVLSVAYAHGFEEDFPASVLDAAERIPSQVEPSDIAGRRDLRALRLVTIDGEDARDFDDAIFVEARSGGGYRLVVAIADVAHYVRKDAPLDAEALHRATSVYFPNHVLPMLPEKLSNGICSLNPGVDRLCMVCDLALDAAGRPLEAELYEAVMHSHARCTYAEVAAVLAGDSVPALAHVADDLRHAGALAKLLRSARMARGTIDFDLPEAKVVLDDKRQPIAIERRERNDAHKLIEEFMLAANEAVARYFSHRGLPTVYRVHAPPKPEKLELFARLAESQGFALDPEQELTPQVLSAFLAKLAGAPQQKALNTLLLRSMMQAIYSPDNIGHFGLASEHYLHFTSPIRRFPDLQVHRLLKEHWARGGGLPSGAAREALEDALGQVAEQSSERERAAMVAEREIDQFFKCVFMRDKVGDLYEATIVAVTDFGFFAELDVHPVEGLVRAEELGTSWQLDPELYRLVFGSGLSFGIGDRIEVQVAAVDPPKRQVSLVLVRDQEGEQVVPIAARRRPGQDGPRAVAGGASLKDAIAKARKTGRGPPTGRPSPRGGRGPGRAGGGARGKKRR